MRLENSLTTAGQLSWELRKIEAELGGLDSTPRTLQANLPWLLACCAHPDSRLSVFAGDVIAGLTSAIPGPELADRFRRLRDRVIDVEAGGGAPVEPNSHESVPPTSRTLLPAQGAQPRKLWPQLATLLASSAGFWQLIEKIIPHASSSALAIKDVDQPLLDDLVREATVNTWVRDLSVEQTIHGIELGFLFASTVLLCSRYVVPRQAPTSLPVREGLVLFRRGMLILYAIWTSVYLVLACDALLVERALLSVAYEPLVWALTDVLNAASSGALLYCFCVLDRCPLAGSREHAGFGKTVLRWWWIVIFVGLLSAGARLGYLGDAKPWIFANSLLGGLAIACLIGRFDSNWMNLPRLVVLPLYAFALLQVLYGDLYGDTHNELFRMPAGLHTALFVVLLGFKLWLIVIVAHTIREGLLGQFLARALDWRRTQEEAS